MITKKQTPCFLGSLLVVLALTVSASAATYSGIAYCGVSTSVSMNTPTDSTLAAGEATGTECATFDTSAIAFSAEAIGASYTLGGFLNSFGAASGITYFNGFNAASDPNNSLWVFSGTAGFTNGQGFAVTHDDGTEMYVNGTNVLNDPGPTPPTTRCLRTRVRPATSVSSSFTPSAATAKWTTSPILPRQSRRPNRAVCSC